MACALHNRPPPELYELLPEIADVDSSDWSSSDDDEFIVDDDKQIQDRYKRILASCVRFCYALKMIILLLILSMFIRFRLEENTMESKKMISTS